ncbi:MAG: Ig-like domain-containing protein [Roseburia sp.]|nr:Ig-like domain-containing protein [Roseburia sp.]
MKKRSIALFMVIAMLFSGTTTVLATEWKSPETESDITMTEGATGYNGDEEYQVKSIEESFSTYSMRSDPSYESEYVTSVKKQSPYETCWAFSTMAASEASLVKSGMYDKDNIDLSEWHLAYFMAHPVTDPLGGTEGDKFTLVYNDTKKNYMMRGGNVQFATMKLASWQGPVMEEVAPYTTIATVANPKTKTDAQLDADASLSEAVAFQDEAHLENAYFVSMEDKEHVKALIKEYGAGATSYYTSDNYYNFDTKDGRPAYYNPSTTDTNHGITLVGWNDEYPKENFKTASSNTVPSNDGAWLCKNSWGNKWGNNYVENGYFWISYEDKAINESNAYFFNYGKADNYEHNYQYDGGVVNWYTWYENSDSMYAANIFQANSNEILSAVGFYTADPNYICEISIYKDCEEGNPVSGKSVVSMKDVEELYAGYHTEKLSTNVFLEKGCRFSVVVRYKTLDGSPAKTVTDYGETGSWYSSVVSAEKGQSFKSSRGTTWTDIGERDNQNCRIKAFTNSVVPTASVSLNATDKTLLIGDDFQLSASVSPDNATNKEIHWSSSDSNVASVDDEGLVTAKAEGKTVITAETADGSGAKDSCEITVEKKKESSETPGGGETPSPSKPNNTPGTEQTETNPTEPSQDTTEPTEDADTEPDDTDTEEDTDVSTLKIQSLSISAISKNIAAGKKVNLTVSAKPQGISNPQVKWTTGNKKYATVNSKGVVTTKKAGKGKTVKITATAKDGSGKKATIKLKLMKNAVTKVQIKGARKTLNAGKSMTLKATVKTNGKNANKSLKWTVSNTKYASVNSKGKVTAKKAGKGKTVTVTAMSTDGTNKKATVKIKIK